MLNDNIKYTVSIRNNNGTPIERFLRENFSQYVDRLDSVFGFLEYCPLYGGRPYVQEEITQKDVKWLYENQIGLRLPLSSTLCKREHYEKSFSFLEKYHRAGNSVIVTRNDLAMWIREDFPLYEIEASVIKDFKTIDQIESAFDIFDTVVLHGSLNTDIELLSAISQKDRIRLFLNMGCAYNCPSKICYPAVSKMNIFAGEYQCSTSIVPRDLLGMVTFDEKKLIDLGFTKFKILRPKLITGTNIATGN